MEENRKKQAKTEKALYDKERKKDIPLYAERIETRRKEKGISQKDLANMCDNISEPSLSNYVSGKSIPSALALKEIAIALDISADYLLGLSPISKNDLDEQSINRQIGLSESAISILKQLQNEKENILGISETIQAINILLSNIDIIEMLSPITEYIYSVKEVTEIEGIEGFDKSKDRVLQFGKDKTKMNEMNELHSIHENECYTVQPLCLFKIQHNFISYIEEYAKKFASQGFDDNYMYDLEKITERQKEMLAEVPEMLNQISEGFRELSKHFPKEGE